MYKKGFGLGIIVLLIGIMIFNVIDNKNKESAIIPNTFDDVGSDGLPVEMAGIKEGELAPDFVLETLEGETAQLSDYRGKKVLLNFWATWCGPCRQEMPAMQEFYDEYAGEIEILAVNVTDSEKAIDDVQGFIDEYDFTYPTLLDIGTGVSEEYMAIGLPTTYFIGTDGKIQAPVKRGEMTYEFMLETMQILE